MSSDLEHLEDVVNHLTELHECAVKMAKGLMAVGRKPLALLLLKRAFSHDIDKFTRKNFKYLRRGLDNTPEFQEARLRHAQQNRHHPEFHDSIHAMSELDVAEMVCDLAARAASFKTGLQDYIDGVASARYNFNKRDKIYKTMMYFKGFVCDAPFATPMEKV